MASKQTYECYVCKRQGFENVRVFLDGKTEDGKTIYKNEDMSAHVHKGTIGTSSKTAQKLHVDSVSLDVLNQKLDEILHLLKAQK
jgi:hypothetical protein